MELHVELSEKRFHDPQRTIKLNCRITVSKHFTDEKPKVKTEDRNYANINKKVARNKFRSCSARAMILHSAIIVACFLLMGVNPTVYYISFVLSVMSNFCWSQTQIL
ncbi:hypothetical protein RUM43_002171 [Polyplax serrata]|uniref:Uncharacterized protein n=1 Tax=Polyplax serrata TaxID=468196 RepID=A0AAN8S5T5_POLSC